jgi:hypothetical protein
MKSIKFYIIFSFTILIFLTRHSLFGFIFSPEDIELYIIYQLSLFLFYILLIGFLIVVPVLKKEKIKYTLPLAISVVIFSIYSLRIDDMFDFWLRLNFLNKEKVDLKIYQTIKNQKYIAVPDSKNFSKTSYDKQSDSWIYLIFALESNHLLRESYNFDNRIYCNCNKVEILKRKFKGNKNLEIIEMSENWYLVKYLYQNSY